MFKEMTLPEDFIGKDKIVWGNIQGIYEFHKECATLIRSALCALCSSRFTPSLRLRLRKLKLKLNPVKRWRAAAAQNITSASLRPAAAVAVRIASAM